MGFATLRLPRREVKAGTHQNKQTKTQLNHRKYLLIQEILSTLT